MGGSALVPRPGRVPIGSAHDRIRDNVRNDAKTGPRFSQLADAHEKSATNAQQYAYDSTTGLFIPVDPPDIPWGQTSSPPIVGISHAVVPKNTITAVGFSMVIAVAASSGNTTAKLIKNGNTGSPIATVTVAAGVHYGNVTISPAIFTGRTDWYQVQVTAVGAGADQIGGGIELG